MCEIQTSRLKAKLPTSLLILCEHFDSWLCAGFDTDSQPDNAHGIQPSIHMLSPLYLSSVDMLTKRLPYEVRPLQADISMEVDAWMLVAV
jgi:hypothetical protein